MNSESQGPAIINVDEGAGDVMQAARGSPSVSYHRRRDFGNSSDEDSSVEIQNFESRPVTPPPGSPAVSYLRRVLDMVYSPDAEESSTEIENILTPPPPSYQEAMGLQRPSAPPPIERNPLLKYITCCSDASDNACNINNRFVLIVLLLGFIFCMSLILYDMNISNINPKVQKGLRICSLLFYTFVFLYHAIVYYAQKKKTSSNFLFGISLIGMLMILFLTFID